ncbi:MAG: curli-like amyloid fiber formation chaperone CsgH [Ignavibacteriaceae bacterium]
MKLPGILIFVLFCSTGYSSFSGIDNCATNKYKTWISSDITKDYLNVKANFENNTDVDVYVSYLLVSTKNGKSGSSNTTQKGTLEIKSREATVLSNVNISVTKSDSYKFILTTIRDKRIIGRDSLLYNIN